MATQAEKTAPAGAHKENVESMEDEKQQYGALVTFTEVKPLSEYNNFDKPDPTFTYVLEEDVPAGEGILMPIKAGDHVRVKFVSTNPQNYPNERMVKVGAWVSSHNLPEDRYSDLRRMNYNDAFGLGSGFGTLKDKA